MRPSRLLRALIGWLTPPHMRQLRAQVNAARAERHLATLRQAERFDQADRERARLEALEKRFAVLVRAGERDAEAA